MKDGRKRGKRRNGRSLRVQRLPENSRCADARAARGQGLLPLRLRRGHLARGERDHGRGEGGELFDPPREKRRVRHQQLHQAAGELRAQVLPAGLHRRHAGADLQLVLLLGPVPAGRGEGPRPGVRGGLRGAPQGAAGGGRAVRGGGGRRAGRHHLQLRPGPGREGGAGGPRRQTDFPQAG